MTGGGGGRVRGPRSKTTGGLLASSILLNDSGRRIDLETHGVKSSDSLPSLEVVAGDGAAIYAERRERVCIHAQWCTEK